MPQASHNPCKFVAALRIQGITPALGDNFSVYNALFDPYENARTAGICGRRGGRSRPLSFLLLFFRRLPAAPKIGPNCLESLCWGGCPPLPTKGAHIGSQTVARDFSVRSGILSPFPLCPQPHSRCPSRGRIGCKSASLQSIQ